MCSLQNVVMHDESAHPHVHTDADSSLPVWMASKASGLVGWVKSLRTSAATGSTLSMQENAAMGAKVMNSTDLGKGFDDYDLVANETSLSDLGPDLNDYDPEFGNISIAGYLVRPGEMGG